MQAGDLVYHIKDWDDKQLIVGIIIELNAENIEGSPRTRVLFTDKTHVESWPTTTLRLVSETQSFIEALNINPSSSVGQSNGLLSRGSQVRVLPGVQQ